MRMNMRQTHWTGLAFAAAFVAAGCDNASSGPTGEIQTTGSVVGRLYLDQNRNFRQDQGDPGVGGITVQISYRGTTIPLQVDTTDPLNGDFRFNEVPVGSHWITLDPATLGDSLDVVQAYPHPLQVLPGQGTTTDLGLAYFHFSIPEARQQPVGTKVAVEGFALNDRTLFGDSTVHMTDGVTSIRATTVLRAPIQRGDSIRAVGRIQMVNGQPVVDLVTTNRLAFTGVPAAPALTTAQAASAAGAGGLTGDLDAGQARVPFATVVDTITVSSGDFRVRVNDGSGLLSVILDKDVPFNRSVFQVDSVMTEIRGLLLPTGTGSWDLKPRGMTDIIP